MVLYLAEFMSSQLFLVPLLPERGRTRPLSGSCKRAVRSQKEARKADGRALAGNWMPPSWGTVRAVVLVGMDIEVVGLRLSHQARDLVPQAEVSDLTWAGGSHPLLGATLAVPFFVLG